jgi:hypothetical protein
MTHSAHFSKKTLGPWTERECSEYDDERRNNPSHRNREQHSLNEPKKQNQFKQNPLVFLPGYS